MSKAKPDAAAKPTEQTGEVEQAAEQVAEQWYVAKNEPVFDETERVWFSQGIPRPAKSDNQFVKDAVEQGRLERYDPTAAAAEG